MITKEDYVSFKTAKLLKEKGFDVYVRSYYEKYKTKEEPCIYESPWNWNISSLRYSAPTLQMAMKWLREVHKIGVFPTTYSIMRGDDVVYVYDAIIINLSDHTLMTEELELEKDSYEESTEAAIKYCLENLI